MRRLSKSYEAARIDHQFLFLAINLIDDTDAYPDFPIPMRVSYEIQSAVLCEIFVRCASFANACDSKHNAWSLTPCAELVNRRLIQQLRGCVPFALSPSETLQQQIGFVTVHWMSWNSKACKLPLGVRKVEPCAT